MHSNLCPQTPRATSAAVRRRFCADWRSLIAKPTSHQDCRRYRPLLTQPGPLAVAPIERRRVRYQGSFCRTHPLSSRQFMTNSVTSAPSIDAARRDYSPSVSGGLPRHRSPDLAPSHGSRGPPFTKIQYERLKIIIIQQLSPLGAGGACDCIDNFGFGASLA